MADGGRQVELCFVDPDIVEEGNVPRQNFIFGEVGQRKADVLAYRYSRAWGLDIGSVAAKFDPYLPSADSADCLVVLIGCVDNAAARSDLNLCLTRLNRNAETPKAWWLDCGNDEHNGQVMLGAVARDSEALRRGFELGGWCTALPSPVLQDPSLLTPRVDEVEGKVLSCAQMAQLSFQSLSINGRVATEAFDFLLRLLVTRDLMRFSTAFNLQAGTATSQYTSPAGVAKALSVPDDFFMRQTPGGAERVRVRAA